MKRFDADYYERRAARERERAEKATPWFAAIFLRTAEEFDRRAERCRAGTAPAEPRRLVGSRRAPG
ncbi:hypothetical protein [Sphingomonas montanisoli]|uniref:Uncharacterized protein n=1 Tax=Sphingomonas montanisoli TaxID=2606412 RepID=A0A5D9C454_9SPHN|nr:hypothetical protein [Sphingomonas montanisoli]TZG25770.1 hypothetical protein FYJ91_12290 [Sphingomonas montanisoli]